MASGQWVVRKSGKMEKCRFGIMEGWKGGKRGGLQVVIQNPLAVKTRSKTLTTLSPFTSSWAIV